MSANPDRATPPGAGAGAGPPLPQEALDAMFWVDTTLYLFSCFFAILCYDMVVAFRQEYKLIWKSRNSVIKWLYLFTRYWAFIAMLITLVMYNVEVTTEQCDKYVKVEPLVPIGIVLGYQAILLARAHAMWNQSVVLLVSFSLVLAGEAAYLIYVVTQCHALPYPTPTGPCVVDGPHGIITAYFLVPLAVDALLTAVTFYKVFQMKKASPNSAVIDIFAREGLYFFFCVTALNLANGILYVQPNPMIRTIFAASAFILSSILACRLVLSLRGGDIGREMVTGRNEYPMSRSGGSSTGAGMSSGNRKSGNHDPHASTVEFVTDLEKADKNSFDDRKVEETRPSPAPTNTGVFVTSHTAVHQG